MTRRELYPFFAEGVDAGPSPRFDLLRHFQEPQDAYTGRDEVDFVRWVYMLTGMTYDEAEAEIRDCTTLLDGYTHKTPTTYREASDLLVTVLPLKARKNNDLAA